MSAQSFGQKPQIAAHQPPRPVGFLLGLGILLAPWLFAWFLLRPGYSRFAKVVGLGWCGIVVMTAFHQGDRPAPGSRAPSATAATSGTTISPLPGTTTIARQNWQYTSSKDEMRGITTDYAEVLSNNRLVFAFPYAGGSTANLMLRRRSSESVIMLSIDKGQFTCFDSESLSIAMKFDNGPVQYYSCTRASDGSSNVIFLGPEDEIIRQLKTARQVMVEAEFYQEGSQQMVFQTAGLQW